MSEVVLESAALLCSERIHSNGASAFVVERLTLPGSKPLLHHDPFDPYGLRRSEHELQWPPEMLDRLGEYYDRYLSRPNNEAFNCHTFGAAVTGQANIARLGDRAHPINTIKGQAADPSNIQNTQLYGVFRWLRGARHTFVGTQSPAMSIGVNGWRNRLALCEMTDLQKIYPGAVHEYSFATAPNPVRHIGTLTRNLVQQF